jgi:hypothetical protein
MPFFFRPGPTMPANPVVETLTQQATVPAPSYGQQVVAGATHVEVPFEVDASTFQIEALIEWFNTPQGSQEDVDYELLDPDGNVIASSGGPAGASEYVNVAVRRPGTYTHRIIGYVNAATDCTITTTFTKGNLPPGLQAITGDFTNAEGKAVDFDGNVTIQWAATDNATGYEVERSSDGTNYEVIATMDAGQTSKALADQPNGENFYRVRALAPGQIGSYVTAPSNAQSIVVDRRGQVEITSQIKTAMSNVTFTGGVFKLDLDITNNSTETYVPVVNLNIIRINSASGTVSVRNAENGGDGKSIATSALFGYSNLLGSDQQFSPAEKTGARSIEFQDNASELFSFDVVVTAYQRGAGGAGATGAGGTDGGATSAGGSSGGTSLQSITKVMRITVNPLTKSVVAKLL